jgi:hypothetical protein
VPQGGDQGGGAGGRPGRPGDEDAPTRRVSPEDAGREAATREDRTRAGSSEADTASRRAPGGEDPETHVIRTPGAHEEDDMPYTREERLRDVYGGVDWLASFIGCVCALVFGGLLLLLVSSLVLGPLGFTLDLEGREIDSATIVGLVVVGVILFLAYFIGGYIAGRLVRFDGGRNGAATVGWGILLGVIFAVFGFLLASLLPGTVFELLRGLRDGVLSTVSDLTTLGLVGAGIIVGALLLVLLGGFLGGVVGNRYHTRIDRTN